MGQMHTGTPCGLTQSMAFKMEDPSPNPGSHTGHFYETEWVISTTPCCSFSLSQISVAKCIAQSQHRMPWGNKGGNNKSRLFWRLQGVCIVQNNGSYMWLSRQDSSKINLFCKLKNSSFLNWCNALEILNFIALIGYSFLLHEFTLYTTNI